MMGNRNQEVSTRLATRSVVEGGTSTSGGQSVPKTLRGRQSSGSIASRSRQWVAPVHVSNMPHHVTGFSPLFRVLLLRRLQLRLPLTVRTCRCGRSLDALGHHRAACARAGVLGRRDTQLRVWRQGFVGKLGGGCEDLDLDVHNAGDAKRLEVVADGLLLFGGAQWQWTPPWSAFFRETGLQEQGQREGTVLRW